MKCDELQQVEYPIEWGLYYDKNKVDAAIAELKAKLYEAEEARIEAGADAADYYQENRKLKRALWLARAERAKAIKWHEGLERYLQERKKYWPSRFSFMKDDEMYHLWYKCWCKVERKCLAKAEGYK